MWKVKLDNDVWLAKEGTTTNESEAWLFPDMPSVHERLQKTRLLIPYKEAMVIAEFEDCDKDK